MRRQLVFLVVSLALGSVASAKPRSTQPDKVLDTCKWAAEVEILEVEPSPGKGWPPTIRVRTATDAAQIFAGQKPGVDVVVHPREGSYTSAPEDLAKLVGTQTSLLMVVDADDRIAFVGAPTGSGTGRSYLLRTWYDYNAWWMFSLDKKFGRVVKLGGGPMQTMSVTAAQLRTHLAKRAGRSRSTGAPTR